jgi:hypothetical protein
LRPNIATAEKSHVVKRKKRGRPKNQKPKSKKYLAERGNFQNVSFIRNFL